MSWIYGISYETVYVFSGQLQGTRTEKSNKPKTAEDSREMQKTIRSLRFNFQNTLKYLKWENNYHKSRMSLHINLGSQGFLRRLAIQGVLTNLQSKKMESTGKKNKSFKTGHDLFFRTGVPSSLETHQNKTKLYIYSQNGQDEREKNGIKFPGVQIQRSITAWGCLSNWGFGCLELFGVIMDSSHYVENTSSNCLFPSIAMMYPFGERFVFQQDNAPPPHTAQISKIWLQ